jgi:hypothetical protein
MPVTCKICMAMCGNVVQTGMERILQLHKPILQALLQVRSAFFVAEAGATVPSFTVQPIAPSATRTAAVTSTMSGFACLLHPSSMTPPDSVNNEPTYFQYLYKK